MDSDFFLKKLFAANSSQLPGEEAHKRMAPFNRPLSSEALKTAENYKESAVAVICYPSEKTINCILTQRPFYEGAHSGQISFPGGKLEPMDKNSIHTACRECEEEIGIQLSEEHHLGMLTEVFIPVSNFLVRPHLFYFDREPQFRPDVREVAEIITFSLQELTNEAIISTMEIRFPNGMIQQDIPCFQFGTKKVWGATALILNELRELLLRD
jgi:8-oxo-dGTP pyrophosphatase MutT (NUDIX family)